jgi:hypothetical protein
MAKISLAANLWRKGSAASFVAAVTPLTLAGAKDPDSEFGAFP